MKQSLISLTFRETGKLKLCRDITITTYHLELYICVHVLHITHIHTFIHTHTQRQYQMIFKMWRNYQSII